MKLNCIICGKERSVKPSDIKLGRGKYCSIKCRSLNHTGNKNHKWNGGQITRDGYICILRWDHPQHDRHGYVKRANLVAEEKYGRSLLADEMVHHVNEIRSDDSPENLQIVKRPQHAVIHFSKPKKVVVCRNCHREFIDERSQHMIFCGIKCANIYNHPVGPTNASWKHGRYSNAEHSV